MVLVIVNGKQSELDDNTTLKELIELKKLQPEKVVVEYNLNIVPKENWDEIVLKENDKLEILSFVGGG